MADKISTVVLKVDLECERCYKKIRKVLCKIQDKVNIKTISFDEKSNCVTVSGPFDAEEVCRKLCCEAGKVIREMHVKGGKGETKEPKDKDGGGDKAKAAKPAEKDGGKAEKKDAGGKAEKEGKGDKKDAAAKPDKENPKDAKPEKKVKFHFVNAPAAADAKPGKAMQLPPGMSKADLGPLLEKMMQAKQGGPEPPHGQPMMVPHAQGVAGAGQIGSVSCYSYNPAAYDQSSYYGGGGGGAPAAGYYGGGGGAPPSAGYYGVPVYNHQGWYHGSQQRYYQHQQHQQHPCCSEDPNAGCSVM